MNDHSFAGCMIIFLFAASRRPTTAPGASGVGGSAAGRGGSAGKREGKPSSSLAKTPTSSTSSLSKSEAVRKPAHSGGAKGMVWTW